MIEVEGEFYANDHFREDGAKETNIILVLPRKETTPKLQTRTETMWLIDGNIQCIYENNWISDFFKREATEEEIALFKKARSGLGKLKTFGQIIVEEVHLKHQGGRG
ncbi:hypothetical protein CD798_08345 [Bacillaceae bacterium SAOS 7]|nr:hypothetical protein CD798_08345 [Bacillaceae bacterium SAOS 7]